MGLPNNPYRPVAKKDPAEGSYKDWRTRAECKDDYVIGWLNPRQDKWFSADPKLIKEAKAICNNCPVLMECLGAAIMEEREQSKYGRHGVRGGLTPKERLRFSRKIGKNNVNE